MRVIVIGSGGREHALAWKISESDGVSKVYTIPASGAKENYFEGIDLDPLDGDAIADFANENMVDLVVIGPEAPLVSGVADVLRSKGVSVFGPGANGAQLEGSKVFAKEFMASAGIPTARFWVARSMDDVDRALSESGEPLVVKCDGLAGGKGVVVSETLEETREAASDFLSGRFGEAGRTLVLEERLQGREVSFFAITDGKRYHLLVPSRDHKRLLDGGNGPNTGGMGAYAPVEDAMDLMPVIRETIFDRVMAEFEKQGMDYRGVLYAGVMLTNEGPKVLEFNVRFGDPETQPLMALMLSDIVPYLLGVARGALPQAPVEFMPGATLTVVMAAEGYPTRPRSGDVIEGLEDVRITDDVRVFIAGADLDRKAGRWITSGGRVLGVTAKGKTLEQARERAYEIAGRIAWPGVHYRKDIGVTTTA